MVSLPVQFATFGLIILFVFVLTHYFVKYTRWRYKQYHQDDLQFTYIALFVSVSLLVLLIWEMAQL